MRPTRYFAAFTALWLLGCSTEPKADIAVTGKVVAKGKPVSGAMVQFLPTDPSGIPASGRTDASGAYKLISNKGGEGVSAGQYKVVISRVVGADGKEIPEGVSPLSYGGKESLPKFYSDQAASFLKADVTKAAPANFDFDISGQGGAMSGGVGGVRAGR